MELEGVIHSTCPLHDQQDLEKIILFTGGYWDSFRLLLIIKTRYIGTDLKYSFYIFYLNLEYYVLK